MPSVEQLGDLQQPAGFVSPVDEAIHQEHHCQGGRCFLSSDGRLQKNLSLQLTALLDTVNGSFITTFYTSCWKLVTSSWCRCLLMRSLRLVLSFGLTDFLYCHFSGTKGHLMSTASCSREASSAHSESMGNTSGIS